MHAKIEEAVSFIRSKWGDFKPTTSLICGSGWGEVSHAFCKLQNIQYCDIPGMSATTVSGHAGNLLLAEQNNQSILIFQGRRHFYEGEGWGPIQFPVLLADALGAKILFLTNAAGGISSNFQVGDLMVLEDHLNFMAGNPLIGPVLHPKIPRFPDQSQVYDRLLKTNSLTSQLYIKFPSIVAVTLLYQALHLRLQLKFGPLQNLERMRWVCPQSPKQ